MPPICIQPIRRAGRGRNEGDGLHQPRTSGDGRSVRAGAARRNQGDVHAAGTAGGGTAEGGLAGTNIGEGDPNNADLEDATGQRQPRRRDRGGRRGHRRRTPARRAARSAARRPASGPSAARSGAAASSRAKTRTCPNRAEPDRGPDSPRSTAGSNKPTGPESEPRITRIDTNRNRIAARVVRARSAGPIVVRVHSCYSWFPVRPDPRGESAHSGRVARYTWGSVRSRRRSGGVRNQEEASMRAGWTRAVCLAMAAGLLRCWRRPRRAPTIRHQAKGAAAAKADHAEKKPAPPKPKIAVFRLAGDVTELPARRDVLVRRGRGHLAPRPGRADEEGRRGPERQGRGLPPRRGLGRHGPGRGAPRRDGQGPGRRQGDLRPRRLAVDARVRPALGRLAAQRRPDGRPVGHRALRRGALPARPARQDRRQAGVPHLRGVQERRGDLPPRRAEPRGRGDAELAARRHLRRLRLADRPGPEGRRPTRSASGSTAARTRPRRPRPPG